MQENQSEHRHLCGSIVEEVPVHRSIVATVGSWLDLEAPRLILKPHQAQLSLQSIALHENPLVVRRFDFGSSFGSIGSWNDLSWNEML